VETSITPEPTPAEREAVSRALAQLLDPRAAPSAALYASAWRLAGLRENAGLTRPE
jgi:hypothetical protein